MRLRYWISLPPLSAGEVRLLARRQVQVGEPAHGLGAHVGGRAGQRQEFLVMIAGPGAAFRHRLAQVNVGACA